MNMEDELEETEIEGFDAQIQTLFCPALELDAWNIFRWRKQCFRCILNEKKILSVI